MATMSLAGALLLVLLSGASLCSRGGVRKAIHFLTTGRPHEDKTTKEKRKRNTQKNQQTPVAAAIALCGGVCVPSMDAEAPLDTKTHHLCSFPIISIQSLLRTPFLVIDDRLLPEGRLRRCEAGRRAALGLGPADPKKATRREPSTSTLQLPKGHLA